MIEFIQAAKPKDRGVKVIDTSKEQRLKCPECGVREMHVYKKDPSLYFCGHCAHIMPVREIKRDVVVVPPEEERGEDGSKTFITQVRRKKVQRPKGVMEQNLADQGFNVTDYYEQVETP